MSVRIVSQRREAWVLKEWLAAFFACQLALLFPSIMTESSLWWPRQFIIFFFLHFKFYFVSMKWMITKFIAIIILLCKSNHYSVYFIGLSADLFFICGGFCHTLKWNSHGFTCVPHPDPRSHLPLHPLPLGFPNAPGPSACLMHPTWVGDLFHPR